MSLNSKLALKDVSFANKRVICRVDYNVPLDKQQQITDDRRIRATMPTLKHILSQGPRSLILCSHLGRPKGNVVPKMSLRPVAAELERQLGQSVKFVENWRGMNTNSLPRGAVVLLENMRFNLEEEGKGKRGKKKVKAEKSAVAAFRKDLAALGDVFVFDAFATSHRAHSSVVGLKSLPVRAAGLLMQKELDAFSVLASPGRPFCAILGGAKVKDKIKLVRNLLKKVNHIIIGGGMAYTFCKVALGMEIGKSLFDKDGAKEVPKIMAEAKQRGVQIHLPFDFVCAADFDENCPPVYSEGGVPQDFMGLDIGPQSITKFLEVLGGCQTVIANGPMGVFEWDNFALGTWAVLAKLDTMTNATTIVGGGDTAAASKKFKLHNLTHVSTGGGASLELLEGKTLPGIAALSDTARARL